jgi:hypothetical protein
MSLVLPTHVVRNLRAEYERDIAAAQRTVVCDEFNPQLKHIDPHLELVWWPAHNPPAPGFIGGRYHLIRHNPNASGSVEPLLGPNGAYREPDSSLFEWLSRSDMWNDQANRERRRIMQAARDAQASAQQREREDIALELKERVDAATRASVSMTPGWTQTAAGKRARKEH